MDRPTEGVRARRQGATHQRLPETKPSLRAQVARHLCYAIAGHGLQRSGVHDAEGSCACALEGEAPPRVSQATAHRGASHGALQGTGRRPPSHHHRCLENVEHASTNARHGATSGSAPTRSPRSARRAPASSCVSSVAPAPCASTARRPQPRYSFSRFASNPSPTCDQNVRALVLRHGRIRCERCPAIAGGRRCGTRAFSIAVAGAPCATRPGLLPPRATGAPRAATVSTAPAKR